MTNSISPSRTDPLASTIAKTLSHIVVTPLVYKKIRAQIDNLLEGSNNGLLSDLSFEKLSYIQAVVREGLRLFPIMAIPFSEAPKEGLTIAGIDIPERTQIGFNILGLMYSKHHFGDDAIVFRPERWLEDEQQAIGRMSEAWATQWHNTIHGLFYQHIAEVAMSRIITEVSDS